MNVNTINIGIKYLDYYLPEHIVGNTELALENPGWDMEKVEKKSGVKSRHISGLNETALDLSVKACESLFQKYNLEPDTFDGIVYCTQSPDYIMPSNAYLIQKHFKINKKLFAFDYNLACSGYIYGLAMCYSFIKSRLLKNILLINSDTYSKFINKKDRSARVLFGDGAAVSCVTENSNLFDMLDFEFSSSGKDYDKFIVPAGGCRLPKSNQTSIETEDENGNIRTKNDIYMDGMGVWAFINSEVPKVINSLLKKNNMNIFDVDKFIFHQASKMTLDSLVKVLKIDKNKSFTNIESKGNTVSASIPIAIKDAYDSGFLKKDDICLLAGFGVGLSVAACLVKINRNMQ